MDFNIVFMEKTELFKYLVTRPYWNSNSHPEQGEVEKEWLISHFCYVFYDRELTEEEIQKYQIIPTYQLDRMVGKTYFVSDNAFVKIIKVDGYYVTVQVEDCGIKENETNYPSQDILKWSKEWKIVDTH